MIKSMSVFLIYQAPKQINGVDPAVVKVFLDKNKAAEWCKYENIRQDNWEYSWEEREVIV